MNISFSRVSRALFLLPLLVVGIFSFGIRAQAFSGAGDGLSASTAFIITTCAQLQEMNDDLSAYYKLGNDIDCASTATWNGNVDEWVSGTIGGTLIPDSYTIVENNGYSGFEPIGQVDGLGNGSGFTGTLDGQNHTISNLWVFRKTTDFGGLIGKATNATIKNVTLDNAKIVGRAYTGGFVGYGSGTTLENLTNHLGMVRAYLAYYGGGIAGQLISTSTATELTVTGGNVHGSGNIIGGLIGYVDASTVTSSTSSAAIDGGEYIGGAFGQINNSTITDITASGNVVSNNNEDEYLPGISKSGNYTGGFAGYITQSTITNGDATGLVTAEGDYAGGFAGYIEYSGISNSSATGDVAGNESVGGFGGMIFTGQITDTIATGDVTSIGGNIGGFVGQSYCESVFLRVSASGNVNAGNGNAGGFTGFDGCQGTGSTFNQVSAHGNVTGNNVIGGFVGASYISTFINVYSGGSASGNDQVGSFAGTLNSGNVTNAYTRGLVILTDVGTLVGGFANDATDTIFTNSFWDGEAIGKENACNTGACSGLTELTTTQAKTRSTYTAEGWDFNTIWAKGSDNDGYPFFRWEPFENEELSPYVLTAITPIPSVVNGTTATYTFAISGTGEAQYMAEMCGGNADGAFTHMADDPDHQVFTLFNLEPGITYECQFAIQSLSGYSNFLHVGPFSVQLATSSGSGRPWVPTQVQTPVPAVATPDTCAVDQLLTQNMKAGARNGKYHPYTKAVVTEVKILQAHMNRLGFNSGPIDGILGKLTDGAIKRMQKYLGTYQDGLVGPITRNLINKSCGSGGLMKS